MMQLFRSDLVMKGKSRNENIQLTDGKKTLSIRACDGIGHVWMRHLTPRRDGGCENL